jgi:transcriptional regulator with XRE-family HTH domain
MASTGVYRALGERIARLRRGLGLTQVELAERVGLSRASIASIEAGRQRISLDQVYLLAGALGISRLDELVSMEVPSIGSATPIGGGKVVSRVQSAQIDGILRAALAKGRK